jgi:DNA-binding NarL/FixJ family response regulator
MESLRVLLVDNSNLFRLGVASLLTSRQQIKIVGQAGSGKEAISQARQSRPDVVLTEIHLPDYSGLELTRVIHSELPQIKVVILTDVDDRASLLEAVYGGAAGYLLKDLEPDQLFQMLEKIMQGEAPFSGEIATMLLSAYRQKKLNGKENSNQAAGLTRREEEVLAEVVKGATNKEIANTLSITENTVKSLLCNILEKLRVHNRIQAAVLAVKEGLLDHSAYRF